MRFFASYTFDEPILYDNISFSTGAMKMILDIFVKIVVLSLSNIEAGVSPNMMDVQLL